MKKIISIGIVVLVLVGAVVYMTVSLYSLPDTSTRPVGNSTSTSTVDTTPSTFDGKNTSFYIDGKTVSLVNGISETPIVPGSASKMTVRYFGNEAYGDLDGDGSKDTAFLVTEDTGGSGLFYYVVVALNTSTGYRVTNAFFIGDRIAPQSTQINSSARELLVNFAERKAGEPMTTQPSVGATMLLKVSDSGALQGLMSESYLVTYTNTKYGFSFSYPAGMTIEENPASLNDVSVPKVVVLSKKGDPLPILYISVSDPKTFSMSSPAGETTYDSVKKEWNVNTGDSRHLDKASLAGVCPYLNKTFGQVHVYSQRHSSMSDSMSSALVTNKGDILSIATISDSGPYDATTTSIYNSFHMIRGVSDLTLGCVQIPSKN